jgi:cell wall-associated NlpC family hydrolase
LTLFHNRPATALFAVTGLLVCISGAAFSAPKAKKPAAKPATIAASPPASESTVPPARRGAGLGLAIATKALSYRGTRYVFGGTSPRGVDCSGLAQSVYKQWGLMLPRTSTGQHKEGIAVPKDQLQPGDLVFFKNTYRRGISHVGIYVGANHFVHAAHSRKGVIVTSLEDKYYKAKWAGARRVTFEDAPAAPPAARTVILAE